MIKIVLCNIETLFLGNNETDTLLTTLYQKYFDKLCSYIVSIFKFVYMMLISFIYLHQLGSQKILFNILNNDNQSGWWRLEPSGTQGIKTG